jgi:tetratricopeptide (TPR) repeat protein
LFEALVAQTASNTNLAEMVINEELLPKERLTPFYRAMVAFHQQSTPAYSGRRSYYEEQSQASPFETWERRLVEYLIEQGQLLSAEQEIASFKQTLHPRAPTPDWCTLDQAKIEIRSSRREEALKRLREWITSAGSESAPNKERFLQVSALLNAEGLRREANEFLLDMYSRLLTSGERNNANFIGLAEVLFNLDRTQEALDALRRMVNRSLDHYETLPLAAEVAFRYKRFGEAMEYRSRLAKMNAEAAENQVELARAQAAAGNVRAAVETLAALLKDRKTSGTTAATAIELLPDLIKENPQQALAWVPADSNRLLAARAAILRQAGQRDQALRALEPALADRYNVAARIERALIEQPAKLQSWEEVLFMDPEEGIANSFVFAASTPRMQLARLYVQVGRHEAALKIGESVVSSQVSVVRGQSSVVGSSEQRTTGDEQRTNPLGTMQERNAAAVGEQRIELLETLAQAARKLGNYQRALEFLQARRALLREASAIRATEQLIAEVKREKEQADRRAVERMVISRNEVHLGLK